MWIKGVYGDYVQVSKIKYISAEESRHSGKWDVVAYFGGEDSLILYRALSESKAAEAAKRLRHFIITSGDGLIDCLKL